MKDDDHLGKKQIPLSASQKGLLFFDQIEPDHQLYNELASYRLQGDIHFGHLRDALNTCVTRHEALRTTFSIEAGEFFQWVHDEGQWPIEEIDIRDEPEDRKPELVDRIMLEFRRRSYDLERGPLCRALVLRLSDDESLLGMAYHHIIVDGVSFKVLFEEAAQIYSAKLSGSSLTLPEVTTQFADFTQQEKAQEHDGSWEDSLAYWRENLEALENLDLPTLRSKGSVVSEDGGHLTMHVPAPLSEQVDAYCKQRYMTPFMAFLAGFSQLMNRYTGQSDLPIGTVLNGRTDLKFEETIGFFVNTVVLRLDLTDTADFDGLTEHTREMVLNAIDHADVPFEKVVEALNPERQIGQHPFFRVMFTLVDLRTPVSNLGECLVSSATTAEGSRWNDTSKFDLTFTVLWEDDGYDLKISYKAQQFDATFVERMLRHYLVLLEASLANPHASLGDLQLLTPEEETLMLKTWNETHREYPRDKCVQTLIEETVERAPQAVAVESDSGVLRYAELNLKANQLAYFLREQRVGAGSLVAICVERGFELTIGLLGILKAGAAYLPIDPNYPQDRIDYILEHCGANVLLTQESLGSRWVTSSLKVVPLDRDWDSIAQHETRNPDLVSGPDDLAYVIYTSGSTGKPKGVGVPQRALVNQCVGAIDHFRLGHGQRRLQAASPGFDVATGELFPTWVAGDTVVLWPGPRLGELDELLAFVQRKQLTIIGQPSSYWHQWVSEIERGSASVPESLETVVVGSELVLPDRVNAWMDHVPAGVRWCNAYGPTETTITATIYEPEKGDRFAEGDVVPIGRPLCNTCIFILDTNLQPVPLGVPGEIYIGGDRLADGYIRDAEQTAARFINWSYKEMIAERVYATGDLGRYREDGQIEFLGRKDEQIQLRGFRVELGEISNVLGQHPSVDDVAVIPWEEEHGNVKGILAYVVYGSAHESPEADLRGFLKGKLPDYMVPARIIGCDQLPLTKHGKLDRSKLPAPEEEEDFQSGFAEPANPTEEAIADIWRAVFNEERIGRHDDFYSLGGHSLTAMQLASRIRSEMDVEIHLVEILEYATVEELANFILERKQGDSLS